MIYNMTHKIKLSSWGDYNYYPSLHDLINALGISGYVSNSPPDTIEILNADGSELNAEDDALVQAHFARRNQGGDVRNRIEF